jgi:hypothetical protein
MRHIEDSLKTDPVINTSLARSYKAEQIKDGLKTDPVISFTCGVNCEMEQIQDSRNLIP